MRYFLTAFFILLGCYLIVNLVGFLEAHKLCISHAVLRPSKTSKNDVSRFVKQKGSYAKNVDPSSLSNTKNTKILFISDLHAEFCFIPAAKVIDTIRKANVDAVVFGGDICNDPLKHEVGTSYLFEIKKHVMNFISHSTEQREIMMFTLPKMRSLNQDLLTFETVP